MNSFSRNIDHKFERDLRWKLRKRARTTAEQFQVLVNIFQYHDRNQTGKISKDQWIQALYEEGLIDFSQKELNSLFEKYAKNEKDPKSIDYKEFSFNFLFKYFNTKTPLTSTQNSVSISSNTYKNYSLDTSKSTSNINVGINYLNKFNIPIKNEFSTNNIFNNYHNTIDNIYKNSNSTNNIMSSIGNTQTNLRYKNNFGNNLNNRYYQINTANNNNISNTELNNISNVYNNITRNKMRIIINNFRNKININNGVIYYRFALKLKENSENNNNEFIKTEVLPIVLQDVGIFYTQREFQNFISLLTLNNSDKISITKMLELIKGNLSNYRKSIISNIFSNLLKYSNEEKIDICTLKKLYKPEMNPEVLTKKIGKDTAFAQFSETLDNYMKIKNIENCLNLSQFIEYYSGISSSIYDDTYFKNLLYNVWGIIDNYNNGKKNVMNNIGINQNKRECESSNVPKVSINNYELDKYKKLNRYNTDGDKLNSKINLPLFYYNKNKDFRKSNNNDNINLTSSSNGNKLNNGNNRYNSYKNYMNFDLNDINVRNEY